jgi:hypothetical protein
MSIFFKFSQKGIFGAFLRPQLLHSYDFPQSKLLPFAPRRNYPKISEAEYRCEVENFAAQSLLTLLSQNFMGENTQDYAKRLPTADDFTKYST